MVNNYYYFNTHSPLGPMPEWCPVVFHEPALLLLYADFQSSTGPYSIHYFVSIVRAVIFLNKQFCFEENTIFDFKKTLRASQKAAQNTSLGCQCVKLSILKCHKKILQ